MILFGEKTQEECAGSLARYYPGGKLFIAKNLPEKNMRKFIDGLAVEICRGQSNLITFEKEIVPDEIVLQIPEWERAVGIPDNCFDGTGTVEVRRQAVLVKLASSGVQTAQDFIDLAKLFGIDINIIDVGAQTEFPLTFPFTFISQFESAYTIFVTFTELSTSVFPLEFPFTFGVSTVAILECLFNNLKPANTQVIFQQV